MRELILSRINDLKSLDNFSSKTTRWKNIKLMNVSTNTEIHLENINFNELNDADLLLLFERIIRQYNKQM